MNHLFKILWNKKLSKSNNTIGTPAECVSYQLGHCGISPYHNINAEEPCLYVLLVEASDFWRIWIFTSRWVFHRQYQVVTHTFNKHGCTNFLSFYSAVQDTGIRNCLNNAVESHNPPSFFLRFLLKSFICQSLVSIPALCLLQPTQASGFISSFPCLFERTAIWALSGVEHQHTPLASSLHGKNILLT
jgi:hypothetical protein